MDGVDGGPANHTPWLAERRVQSLLARANDTYRGPPATSFFPSWETLLAEKTLGAGDNAVVYLIWNVSQFRRVARKVMRRCDDKTRRSLRKEVEVQKFAAERGIAPGIVAFNEARCTIDMEVVDGRTLKQICADGDLTEARQRGVIKLIEHLVDEPKPTRLAIQHPDLHASNILERGDAFVAIDFDGARIVDNEKGTNPDELKGRYLSRLLCDKTSGLLSTGLLELRTVPIFAERATEWNWPLPLVSQEGGCPRRSGRRR
jgi:predicted Ser/Thr protein kinase